MELVFGSCEAACRGVRRERRGGERGPRLVEVNPAWASGCPAGPAEVFAVLRGCVAADEAGEAARWLGPRASVTPWRTADAPC